MLLLLLNVGQMRTYLATYAVAVFDYWWAFIFAAPAALDLIGLMRPSVDVSRWKARQRIWIPLAIFGVVVAQFLVWLDLERRSGISIVINHWATSVATFPYPIAWENRQRCGEESTLVMFNLTVTNGGEPTVLQDWGLHATTGDNEFDGRLAFGPMPKQLVFDSGEIGELEKDWLSSRINENPIDRGARRDGWVPFCFRGVH